MHKTFFFITPDDYYNITMKALISLKIINLGRPYHKNNGVKFPVKNIVDKGTNNNPTGDEVINKGRLHQRNEDLRISQNQLQYKSNNDFCELQM